MAEKEVRLIDANALKEHISSYAAIPADEGLMVSLDVVFGWIDFSLTVNPESLRPHGEWIESLVLRTDMSALYNYTCSECAIVSNRESKYCPNCGAKMGD